jgi:two-component system response regulator NreC
MFGIAIYAERPTIITSGIQTTLRTMEEIDQCVICTDEIALHMLLKSEQIQILFIILRDAADSQYALIKDIRSHYDRVRIIAFAPKAYREMVFSTVKYGASGFLTAETTSRELMEAVYTIHAGHEYFSSSITSLLVSNYVEAMRSEPTSEVKDIDKLSKRELEILTLWGEGHTNIEIADSLFISTRTVESHKNHIMQKLGIHTTVDLLKFAIRNNIVSI